MPPGTLPRLTRRSFAGGCIAALGATAVTNEVAAQGAKRPAVETGAQRLAASGFERLAGRRVALLSNHTGLVGTVHLADLMAGAGTLWLSAILAPEHGFRGGIEAGKKVRDDVDPRTKAPIHSLYGATRKPTREMLRNIDVIVFDIQDIGARFYTYISTMGLAMQAAAEAKIPFVVLDRPNPIGGVDVAGFVLQPALRSFVGQYTIPIVHGMTVGELARMIKGRRLLDGLETLDLEIIEVAGWRRAMRWPQTGLTWIPTSPNIPTFASALVYPGIGMVGELEVNEGRGTPIPFQQFGAPWLDAPRLTDDLNALKLPGIRFSATRYTPRAIPGVAADPRFEGREVQGIKLSVTDGDAVRPLEIGMHVMSRLVASARAKRVRSIYASDKMFNAIAGTPRLREMLDRGATGGDIIAAWQGEVRAFVDQRRPFLLYG